MTVDSATITDDTPLRLAVAAAKAFPGGDIVEYPLSDQSADALIIRHMMSKLGRQDCVYFVGFNKWVKIGFSSKIWTRIEKLDCMPEPVKLLALVPGDRHIEWGLHDRFAKYHTHAEWFLNEGKLAAHIRALRDRAEKSLP